MFRSVLPTRLFVFVHRFRWLHVPMGLLVALLQRTPAVRVALAAEEAITASPASTLLRSAVTALASLGAVQALAGATQWQLNPGGAKNENATVPISATVGTATSVSFTVTGAPSTPPGSFRITGLP